MQDLEWLLGQHFWFGCRDLRKVSRRGGHQAHPLPPEIWAPAELCPWHFVQGNEREQMGLPRAGPWHTVPRLYHDSPALGGVSSSPASYTNEETEVQSGPILCPKSQQTASSNVLVIPNSKACLSCKHLISLRLHLLVCRNSSVRSTSAADWCWTLNAPTCSLGLGPCSCSLLGGRAEASPLFLNQACQGMAADMEL